MSSDQVEGRYQSVTSHRVFYPLSVSLPKSVSPPSLAEKIILRADHVRADMMALPRAGLKLVVIGVHCCCLAPLADDKKYGTLKSDPLPGSMVTSL